MRPLIVLSLLVTLLAARAFAQSSYGNANGVTNQITSSAPSGGTVGQAFSSNGNSPGSFQSQPIRMGWSISGAPSASQIFPQLCLDNITFPANFAGSFPDANSQISCGTPPNENDTYTIKANGAAIGSLVISGISGPLLVQQNGATSGTISLPFPSITTTAGNTVVVLYEESSTSFTPSISDNRASHLTWHSCPVSGTPITSSSFNVQVIGWYANDPTGGTIVVTVSDGSGVSTEVQSGHISEWSGIPSSSPLDNCGSGAQDGGTLTTAFVTGNATTSQNNDVVFGFAGTNASGDTFSAGPTNSFNSLTTFATSGGSIFSAYRVEPTNPGPFSTGWTSTISDNFAGLAFSLKATNLTPSCTPTFTTTGGTTQVCSAGKRLELDAPTMVSGANLAIVLGGHTP